MSTRRILLAAAIMVAIPFSSAHALDATAPITASNGAIGCATCTTSSSNLTDKAVIIGNGGGQDMEAVTPNGTATTKFLTQASGANSGKPQMSLIAETDLPDQTAAEFLARTTGTTGDTSVVFSNAPNITSPTITTSVALPAGAVDDIGEIDDSILSGGANHGATLGTVTGSFTAGNTLTTDANGVITDSGASSASIQGIIGISSETPITAGSATVFLSIGGRLNATELNVLTPVSAGTYKGLRCLATGATGGSGLAISAGVGDCDGTISYADNLSVTVTGTAADSDTSDIMAVTAGQCIVLKVVPSSTTAAQSVNCSIAKSA